MRLTTTSFATISFGEWTIIQNWKLVCIVALGLRPKFLLWTSKKPHHFTVYYIERQVASQPMQDSFNSVIKKKKKNQWDHTMMKEDAIYILEVRKHWSGKKKYVSWKQENIRNMKTEEYEKKICKRNNDEHFLVMCHSSSGHLLYFIKGFALISIPLYFLHDVCVWAIAHHCACLREWLL